MKKHPYLENANKLLKNLFYIKFIDKNVCEVRYEKNTAPFAFLIIEENQGFDGIGLSIALDCNDTYAVAELTITLMHVAPVALADPFFIANNGDLHWNDSALEQWQLETDHDILKDLTPISKEKH